MSHLPFLITWQGGKLKQMLVYIKSALTVMILSNEQRLDKTVSFASNIYVKGSWPQNTCLASAFLLINPEEWASQ